MNRREFLAAGLGALSLAGKFPPARPTFTVEIEVDRAAIWVDGKAPTGAWVHDDGFGSLDINFKGLVVAGVTIESIIADRVDCGCELVGSTVVMVNSKGTFKGKVTHLVEPGVEEKPVKEATLLNGEKLKITEGQRYFRFYFDGGR